MKGFDGEAVLANMDRNSGRRNRDVREDGSVPEECAKDRAVLAARPPRRAICVRQGRAVRPAVGRPRSRRSGHRRLAELVPLEIPIQYRYEGRIFSGEKRTELLVVPALSVRVTPDIAIVPVGVAEAQAEASAAREVRVTVTGNCAGAADAEVALDVPQAGARRRRPQRSHLARADEAATSRFMVYPPPGWRQAPTR